MSSILAAAITLIFFALIFMMLFVVGAVFLLDIKLLRLEKKLQKISPRSYARLAIVIYAHNNSAVVGASLDALRNTKLRSVEVIIIDNASTDKTKQVIKNFQRTYSKFQIRTIFKLRTDNKEQAVKQALKKVMQSKNALVIEAGTLLSKNFIRTWQQKLYFQPIHKAIAVPVLPRLNASYLSVAMAYIETSTYLLKKTFVAVGIPLRATKKSTAFIAPVTMQDTEQSKELHICSYLSIPKYIASVSLIQISKIGTLLQLAALALVPYLVFLAVQHETIQPLFYSFGILLTWLILMLTIVPEINWAEKLTAISMLPMAYPLLYVVNNLRLLAKISFIKNRLNIRVME